MTERIRIDCNLNTIMFGTLAKLIQDGVCNSTTGFIGQNPEQNLLAPSVNYLVVSARKQELFNAETQTWDAEVTVRVYAYSVVDITMRDTINITQQTGISALINGVIQSLHLYDMTNGSVYYLAQPMRYARQDDIHRETEKTAAGLQWSYCDIVFAFVYGEDPTFINPAIGFGNEFTFEYSNEFV